MCERSFLNLDVMFRLVSDVEVFCSLLYSLVVFSCLCASLVISCYCFCVTLVNFCPSFPINCTI